MPCEASLGKGSGSGYQRKGWTLARIQGSHHIFSFPGRRERLVIPVHGNKPLKIGLLRSLMKLAELQESDL